MKKQQNICPTALFENTKQALPYRHSHGCLTCVVVAIAMVTVGCGSSSSISLSLSPSSPQAIDQSQTLAIMATVTNDKSSEGVGWNLTGPGSLSNQTGFSVTYNSPTTNFTSAQTATLTAKSVADPTKQASIEAGPESTARRLRTHHLASPALLLFFVHFHPQV